jgi:hypothetical protein
MQHHVLKYYLMTLFFYHMVFWRVMSPLYLVLSWFDIQLIYYSVVKENYMKSIARKTDSDWSSIPQPPAHTSTNIRH